MLSVKLAIFDMDGTVFESHLDWTAIRRELNLENQNILKEIFRTDGVDREKLRQLEYHERENTRKTRPINGVREFMENLRSRSVKLGLMTNNNRPNTEYLLKKYNFDFNLVVTREMNLWKPDPDAFFYLMNHFQVTATETMSIGDSHYDIQASKLAKIPYIFIKNSIQMEMKIDRDVVFFDDYPQLWRILASKGCHRP